MTGQPLVTIAIPTFRRPDYLAFTLQSVLAQTYSPIEIIVADDASGDRTPQIVAELNDPCLRYRQNEVNIGIVRNFNQCLSEAKGKYFIIICGDDLVSLNFIESLVDRFEKHPAATVGLTRCETIDELGQMVQAFPVTNWTSYSGIKFVSNWLWGREAAPVPTFISLFTRTELLRSVGTFPDFADGSNCENAVIIALALQGDIVFAADALFQYRVYRASYGLSVSYHSLAQSATEFRRHMNTDPVMTRLLGNLPDGQADFIRRGVSRMLAFQYLGRLRTIYLSDVVLPDLVRALRAYDADAEYLRTLPRFFMSVAKHALGRKRSSAATNFAAIKSYE